MSSEVILANVLGYIQLAGLALFLGIFLGRTLYLRIHEAACREYCLRTGRYLGRRTPRTAIEPPADPW